MSALRNEESRRAKRSEQPRELLVERDERVIIEPVMVNGRELTRYAIVTRDEWIEALPEDTPESIRVALSLAGAWSDLDWNETVEALDRIRHESRPSPPIEPMSE